MSWLDSAIKRVRDYDASRPRSRQQAVGWSEAGGCRSAIGYRLDGAFPSETDTWAAQRGTALHEYLLPVIAGHVLDGPADIDEVKAVLAESGARIEVSTEYRGIPGHADLVDGTSVTDAKTTTLANSKLWADDHKLLRPKRIQAHGYAAGLVDAGELPEDCTVRILVIPVDGTFGDWWAYEEPFDRELADEGANRVEWVAGQLAAGETLPKDKPLVWCRSYCPFVDLCRDPAEEDGADLPLIEDAEIAAAVDRYGTVHEQWAPLDKEKERLKPLIRGWRGVTPGGWKVTTSRPGEPGEKPDMDAIEADYAARGLPVPMRETAGKAASATVTRIKVREAAK
jgi:hypothetical protein